MIHRCWTALGLNPIGHPSIDFILFLDDEDISHTHIPRVCEKWVSSGKIQKSGFPHLHPATLL